MSAEDREALHRLSGHPEITAAIALDVALRDAPSVDVVERRVRAAWPRTAGEPPRVEPVSADEHAAEPAGAHSRIEDAVNAGFADTDPLCTVFVTPGAPGRIAVVAHHGVLDGLGLVAVVGAAVDAEIGTSARGIPHVTPGAARLTYGLRRAAEAAFAPPVRVAPQPDGARSGDRLDAIELPPIAAGSAELAVAAVDALAAWNRAHRDNARTARRVMVAVGASRTSDGAPRIGRASAWFRVRVRPGADPADVRRAMAARGPEPAFAGSVATGWWSGVVARALAPRLGSTLLVSSLGRLRGEPLRSAAFYPFAHGRSGVAIGCASTAERTTLTIRARASAFSERAARSLLEAVAGALTARAGGAPRR